MAIRKKVFMIQFKELSKDKQKEEKWIMLHGLNKYVESGLNNPFYFSDLSEYQLLSLDGLFSKSFIGLNKIGIEYPELKYECLYSEGLRSAYYPKAIASNNISKYSHLLEQNWKTEMYFDHEFMRSNILHSLEYPNPIDYAFLGSGRTFMFNDNDGTVKAKLGVIELDNNDKLIAWCWNYYGK